MAQKGKSGASLMQSIRYQSRLIKEKGKLVGVSCLGCKKVKDENEFKVKQGKFSSRCNPCQLEYGREYAKKKRSRLW